MVYLEKNLENDFRPEEGLKILYRKGDCAIVKVNWESAFCVEEMKESAYFSNLGIKDSAAMIAAP